MNNENGNMSRNIKNFQSLIEALDLYTEPINWNMGGNKKYGTLLGGGRTIMIVMISLAILIYSSYLLFTNKKGSFVYYDIIDINADSMNITYFDNFEIFFVALAENTPVILDGNLINIRLAQQTEIDSNGIDDPSTTSNFSTTPNTYSDNKIEVNDLKFEICDSEYFKSRVSIPLNISNIYCVNRSNYLESDVRFTIALKSLIGDNKGAPVLKMKMVCDDNCTEEEQKDYESIVSSITVFNLFISHSIPAANNLTHPVKSAVKSIMISFTDIYDSMNKDLFFRSYEIESDASVFPYMPRQYDKFFTFASFSDNFHHESGLGTFSIKIYISDTFSYISRKYDKIDTLLANFLAVYNVFTIVGKIVAFIFTKFHQQIFLYNNFLKEFLYENIQLQVSNKNNEINIKESKLKIDNSDKFIINIDKNINFKNYYDNSQKMLTMVKGNINTKPIHNNELQIKSNPAKNNTSELKYNSTALPLQVEHLKFKSLRKSTKIQISNFESFKLIFCSFGSKNLKNEKLEEIRKKIQLIDDCFDVSAYIRTIFDVHKIKSLLFNSDQLILFNNITFSNDQMSNIIRGLNSLPEITNSDHLSPIVDALMKQDDPINERLVKELLNNP